MAKARNWAQAPTGLTPTGSNNTPSDANSKKGIKKDWRKGKAAAIGAAAPLPPPPRGARGQFRSIREMALDAVHADPSLPRLQLEDALWS